MSELMTSLKNSNFSAAEYAGEVTVQVKNKQRVLFEKTYHNAGTDLLFRFFCCCLAGDYETAKKLRPAKIKLFYNSNETPSEGVQLTNSVSEYVSENVTATIERDSSGNFCSILHFMLPFSMIKKTESPVVTINQFCLYPLSVTDASDIEKYSAWYLLKKENEDAWDNIEISTTDDVNFIVEWKLFVKNTSAININNNHQ